MAGSRSDHLLGRLLRRHHSLSGVARQQSLSSGQGWSLPEAWPRRNGRPSRCWVSRPSRWVGRISYSLYLWHWPILIIAADEAGKTSLPFHQNVVWLLLAVGLSLASYRLFENPIRHLRVSAKKSIALGVGAVLLTVAALSVAISAESEPLRSYTVAPVADAQTLYRQVAAATSITRVPTDMEPIPTQATDFWGGNFESTRCRATASQWDESICTLGDPTAKRLMVVYGDSHALMWLPTFIGIARSSGGSSSF